MTTKNKESFRIQIAFLDIAFNLLMVFSALFMMSFLNMNKPVVSKNANSIRDAEYIIQTDWTPGLSSDVDSWLMTPSGTPLFFRKMVVGLVHLERDDTGDIKDTYIGADGTQLKVDKNGESIVFRGTEPGRFTLNIHLYDKRDKLEEIPVNVRVIKLNPSYQEIINKTIVLKVTGEEKTIVSFILNERGIIVQKDELPNLFVGKYLAANPSLNFPIGGTQ